MSTTKDLVSCWTIENGKSKERKRYIKLYIRGNWKELADILDKICLEYVMAENAAKQQPSGSLEGN